MCVNVHTYTKNTYENHMDNLKSFMKIVTVFFDKLLCKQ